MLLTKITKLGRYFLAIPLIVFGIQHFIYAEFVATLVPVWIPGSLFWTYFAGVALICSGLGILLNVLPRLAAGLLGLMIFSWILILHIPRIFIYPENHNEFINVFDAFIFCGGAFILAGSSPGKSYLGKIEKWGIRLGPVMIAIALAVFGVEHLVQGKLVFIVGADSYPVAAATLWVFLSGVVFIWAAYGILFSKRSGQIAALLGIFICFIVIVFYVPQFFNTIFLGHTLATFLKGMAMTGSVFNLSRAATTTPVFGLFERRISVGQP